MRNLRSLRPSHRTFAVLFFGVLVQVQVLVLPA
jgi:hypothetical protein